MTADAKVDTAGDDQATVIAASQVTDPKQRKALEAHYGHAVARMLHEYDQRDRDFVMHITINGGLFAAAGFVISRLNPAAPGSLLIGGAALGLIGAVGLFAAAALIGSVNSFKFFQGLMNATLVGLEVAILPDPQFGLWCRNAKYSKHPSRFLSKELGEVIENIDAPQPKKPINLITYRSILAWTLLVAWVAVVIAGVVVARSALVLTPAGQFKDFLRVMWPL